MIRPLLLLTLTLFYSPFLFAQHTSVDLNSLGGSRSPYDWANSSSWDAGGSPGASTDKTVTLPDSDNSGGLSTSQIESKLTNGYHIESSTNLEMTFGGVLNIYGVLVIEGDLTLTNATINIEGGALIVTGNFTQESTLGNSATINLKNSAKIIVDGNYSVTSDGSGSTSEVSTDGTQTDITVGGDLSVNQSNSGTSSISTGTGSLYVNGNTSGNGTVNGSSPSVGIKGDTSEADLNLQSFLNTIENETSANSVLPVDIISFTAIQRHHSILLEWLTAYELDNDYYEIQSSIDGINFEILGRVYGSSDSDQLIKYSYEDQRRSLKPRYYRLKQVDTNGNFSYLKTIYHTPTIDNIEEKIVAFPNPTYGKLQIDMERSDIEDIYVIDANGNREKMDFQMSLWGEINIDLSEKKKGLYFIEVMTLSKRHHLKIILK